MVKIAEPGRLKWKWTGCCFERGATRGGFALVLEEKTLPVPMLSASFCVTISLLMTSSVVLSNDPVAIAMEVVSVDSQEYMDSCDTA
jgi:hypothetical protein